MDWKPIETAPKNTRPFLLGTSTGAIMLEFWQRHSDGKAYGCYSGLSFEKLQKAEPSTKFFWADPEAPSVEDRQ